MNEEIIFKTCPSCGFFWNTREEFVNDKNVAIIGYQVNFVKLESGLFLFNHSCKSTLSIKVDKFKDLYDGPIFQKRHTGSESCGGHCLHNNDLKPCPVECECAFVREIIQILKKPVPTIIEKLIITD